MANTPTPLRMIVDPTVAHVMPSLAQPKKEGGTALTRMPPPPMRLKRPRPTQKIISEDAYTSALNQVIEREYFPDLPKLQQQLEWLNALESGDNGKIAEIQARVALSVMRSDRPYASKTPLPDAASSVLPDIYKSLDALDLAASAGIGQSTTAASKPHIPDVFDDAASLVSWSAGANRPAKRARTEVGAPGDSEEAAVQPAEAEAATAAARMSLGEFHTHFVSEDNASFEANQDKVLAAHQRKHWWVHEFASSDKYKFLLTDGHAARAITDKLRDDNIAGVDLLTDNALGGDLHGRVATWRHRPKNSLFFLPDLEVSNSISRAQPIDTGQRLLTDISHSNSTKVMTIQGMDIILPTGHRIKQEDGGVIAPTKLRRAATRFAGSELHALKNPGGQSSSTSSASEAGIMVNGYDFVATPVPVPRGPPTLPSVDETSALLGISGTANHSAGPTFSLPKESTRDRIVDQISTQTGKRKPPAATGAASTNARRPVFAATPTPGITQHLTQLGSQTPVSIARSVRAGSVASSARPSAGLSPAARMVARNVAVNRAKHASTSITDLHGTGLRAAYSPHR